MTRIKQMFSDNMLILIRSIRVTPRLIYFSQLTEVGGTISLGGITELHEDLLSL